MKLIVEGYPYEPEKVERFMLAPRNVDGKVRVNYVGYFYNNNIKDCVFFLPKVVLDENDMVLGKYVPEDILDVEKNGKIDREDRDFIYGLSVWIYRAIREFQRLNPENEIILKDTFSRIDGSQMRVQNTLIDVILSLIKFNNEHRDFFMFTLKNIHSGYNRINWSRTISKGEAVLQGGVPVYMKTVNKKKFINFDEELLIIFFSILNFIKKKYGFRTPVDYNYELITGYKFDSYMKGYGKIRLRQIKYKYFSDTALALWKHCYAFFELAELINSSHQQKDYMLAKNFNIVFEDMIDELLSDKELEKSYNKDQEDGKRVDHIYAYKGLINEDEKIYYIGDSKYYKIGNKPVGTAVYKQYTYARNVIQYNLKLFLDNEGEPGKDYLIYRDPATEGYNITPNFFISARLNKDYSYEEQDLVFKGDEEPMKHFENRLFDRDTLLLQHYSVNFLFVLALYAGSNDYAKGEFKKFAMNQFRKKIIEYLEDNYQFFSLYKKTDITVGMETVIEEHFRHIIGKTFRPYDDDQILYLSFEQKEEYLDKNKELLAELSEDFDIRGYKLGTDPRSEINKYVALTSGVSKSGKGKGRSNFTFEDFEKEVFLIGGYRSDKEHLKWIKKNKAYNVRAKKPRHGALKIDDKIVSARYLILYDLSNEINPSYDIYPIRHHKLKSEEQMLKMNYPGPEGRYVVYSIGDIVQFAKFSLKNIITQAYISAVEEARKDNQSLSWDAWFGTPIYLTGAELLKMLESSTLKEGKKSKDIAEDVINFMPVKTMDRSNVDDEIELEDKIIDLYDDGLLSARTMNVCLEHKMNKVYDVVKFYKSGKSFKDLRRCGKKTVQELMTLINKYL